MLIKRIIVTYLRKLSEEKNGNIIKRYIKRFILRLRRPYLKIRYMPVIKYLRKSNISSASILEIGSGSLGIALFLPRNVIGLDLDFNGPKLGSLKMIKGDCRALPFKDFSFDYLISMDMLEHIDSRYRFDVLDEMVRVAKKTIFLGFPSSKNAEIAEQNIRYLYEEKIRNWKRSDEEKGYFIKRNLFLLQHKENRLPDTDDILEGLRLGLKKYNCKADIKLIRNESIKVWYYMILSRLELSFSYPIISILINLLPCFLFNLGWGGFYREILIVAKKNENISSDTNL